MKLTRSDLVTLVLAATLTSCLQASAQLILSSNLVQVGVVVSNGKGPVYGLKAEDFVVLDEGRPRKISVFLEQPGVTESPAAPGKNSFSNAAPTRDKAETRVTPTIILMDNLNVVYGCPDAQVGRNCPPAEDDLALARAKPALIAALKEMDLRTPIALYGLGNRFKMLCDFTCSREQLLQAVQRYDPTAQTWLLEENTGGTHGGGAGRIEDHSDGSSVSTASAEEGMIGAHTTASRGQRTMSALQTIAARASTIPGRKNLLWLTANLPYSGEAIARLMTPARITLYPVDARGLQMNPYPVGIEAMQEMAADTGGIAYVKTNDIKGAIHAVIDDQSATYTLGFYVDAASVDGKFHNLKIRLKTPDARLRYARGYFALKSQPELKQAAFPASNAKTQPAGDTVNGPALLAAAINSPFAASAMPLELKLEHDPDNKLRIDGRVSLEGLSLRQDGAVRHGMIVVYMVEQDAAGTVLKRAVHQIQLNLTNEQFAEYTKSGIWFTEAIAPQPQATTFRVIVRDGVSSRLGSVIIPLAKVQ